MMTFMGALNLNNSNERSSTKLHGETFCFIPGSGIYAEKWYLKNGMSHIGLYGSAPPPSPGVVLLSRQKYVRTANAGRTALWNESNSNNGSKTWISFIWILSPQSFCICDCHCFTHQSLLPVFHWHPNDIYTV